MTPALLIGWACVLKWRIVTVMPRAIPKRTMVSRSALDCRFTGVDVAITRTPFATPLILTTLSGHPEVAL